MKLLKLSSVLVCSCLLISCANPIDYARESARDNARSLSDKELNDIRFKTTIQEQEIWRRWYAENRRVKQELVDAMKERDAPSSLGGCYEIENTDLYALCETITIEFE